MSVAEGRPTEQIFASTHAFESASKLREAGLQSTYSKLYEKARNRGADPGRNILLNGVATRDERVRAATSRGGRGTVAGFLVR